MASSSSAKHFLNDPAHLVVSALRAVTLTNPAVALDEDNKIIYRRPGPDHHHHGGGGHQRQIVSIISGGGSGHEPSFAAMVGPGMLSAAVAGTIFASPSAEQVRAAITGRVDNAEPSASSSSGGGGVLVTVMNYTGDILNFGVAVEKARAAGVRVEMVVVADDAGVGRAAAGKVGRRGIAGTVLVHKIAGALAARGAGLADVAKVARLVAGNLVSVGASLDRVHVPGRPPPGGGDDGDGGLAAGEVELGMGIHNEPGSGRERGLDLAELVGRMLGQLLDQGDADRAFLNVNSNEVVLLVNNLGGVSVLEMGGITAEVVQQLERHWGIHPVRVLCGTYMTSLNGPGFSVSLLNVVNTDIGGPGMIELLDAPAEVTGWAAPVPKLAWEAKNKATREGKPASEAAAKPSGLKADPAALKAALEGGLKSVVAAEPEVTKFDTVVGDGDCGIGMKRGAEAILQHLSEAKLTGDVVVDVANIVPIVERSMDGTSGALYAIFMNSLVHSLRLLSPGQAGPQVWAGALKQCCDALAKYTPAQPGDRTLVDALYPFVEVLGKTGDVKKAAEAARNGAEGTKGMKASLGRSVYVGGTGFEKVPDPGAWGLACFFAGLAGLKPAEEGWETV